ncbi:MAG: formate dehydrogenase accessory sulfurtransferase FdhD [Anaerolineae bacterium]
MTNIATTNNPVFPWTIRFFSGGRTEDQAVDIVKEEPLALEVNARQVALLMRAPGAEEELGVGFCLSEGIIGNFEAIRSVHLCAGESMASGNNNGKADAPRNLVEIWADLPAVHLDNGASVVRMIRSGCGSVDMAQVSLSLPQISGHLELSVQQLFAMSRTMRSSQQTYRRTRGIHAAGVFDRRGHLQIIHEDIGRHNAVDKVIGHCLLQDIPLSDKAIVCTGRASHEMVSKAARLNVPLLASFSTPTSLAVQLADAVGLTLVGYLRGHQMNVYTHPQRIVPGSALP